MGNGITKYFTFQTFFYILGIFSLLMATAPIIFNININNYLTDFYRGVLAGVLLLLLIIIIIHQIDMRFNLIKRNGEKNAT